MELTNAELVESLRDTLRSIERLTPEQVAALDHAVLFDADYNLDHAVSDVINPRRKR